MKFKIFFIFLILFLSLNAVSADGNFTQLQTEINDSVNSMDITQNYVYDNSTDYELNKGIHINKTDFTVNGNGYTIDGNGQSIIFIIEGNNITLLNLNIINGFSSEGGAILTDANLTFINCSFTNSLSSTYGGAIFQVGGNIAIINSTFSENIANSGGGAVFQQYGNLIIENCNFADNFAHDGSALCVLNNLNLYSSSFTNSRKINFSQVYINNQYGEGDCIIIDNCSFANTTSKYATAIYCVKKRIVVRNSIFENLHASESGGAVAFKESIGKSTVENCTFKNTTAVKNAGALLNDVNGERGNFAEFEILNTSFINSYGNFGGAFIQFGGNLTIQDSVFINNTALYDGAAVYTSDVDYIINNCTFESNKIINNDCNGGAIYCDMADLVVISSKFTDNTKNALYTYDTNLNLSDTEFKNNGEAIHSVFGENNLVNNTYNNDTLVLNDTYYASIVSREGFDINLVNNTINVQNLPVRFDLREWGWVSSVKNQGQMGSCWTFGFCGALESALLKSTGIEYDFSENNMQDTMLRYSKFGSLLSFESGDMVLALSYIMSWFGPFSSEYDTYDEVGKISPLFFSNNNVQIYDVISLDTHEDPLDNDAYKRAIMEYGSLAITYNACQMEPYFNSTYSSQFQNITSDPDHGVSIVGWDDNFPATNFSIHPPGNGAWIFKNSWDTVWGDEGYGYISYYDASIFTQGMILAFVIENTENYTTNYQTDIGGSLIMQQYDSVKYKTDYTAIGNGLISAVATYFNDASEDYLLEIYVNGELKHTQNGTAPFCGFHTVKLTEEIPVKENDIITPVMTKQYVPIIYGSRLHFLENTSFIDNGTGWVDLALDDQTASLKVFTKDLAIYSQDLVKIYKNDSQFEVNIGVANETVTFEINGANYTRVSDENGTAKMNIDLVPGNYTIETIFNGNAVENTITVLSTLLADNLVKYFRNESQFYISLIDGEGKPVAGKNITMNINGVFYTRVTNENGTARLNINLNPGVYVLTAIDPLTGLQMAYNITVLSVLTADDINMTYLDGTQFKVKLVDGEGNVLKDVAVKFNVNGVIYTRYTDSDGIARLNINLIQGEYIITSQYEDAVISNKITISAKEE